MTSQSYFIYLAFALICTFTLVEYSASHVTSQQQEDVEIHGYHFHTYFFQNNDDNREEALSFRYKD